MFKKVLDKVGNFTGNVGWDRTGARKILTLNLPTPTKRKKGKQEKR